MHYLCVFSVLETERITNCRIRSWTIDPGTHRAVVPIENVFENDCDRGALADPEAATEIQQRESRILLKQLVGLETWSKHSQLHLREGFACRQKNPIAHEAARYRTAIKEACDFFARANSTDARL